jgi:chromosome partitioning protein
MRTLALIAQKGGTGKTTLAVHLAVAAELAGKSAVIIDLDPQASATSWKDLRKSDTPIVVSAQAARLEQVLRVAAENGADLAIIDTAPHSESASLTAARQADLILIPCRPAILDLKAISTSVDLVKLAGKRAAVVLTAVPPRGSLGDDAAAALTQYDAVEVSPVRIGHRAAYIHSLTDGRTAQEYEPEGTAAEEVKNLYRWACKQVRM